MKKILLCCFALAAVFNAHAWGQKGHDVTAWIAEQHLTPEAAAAVDRILGGHSLVYYANWMDNASNTPEYAYSKTWHYLNIDEGETLETQPRHPQGDVLTALDGIIKRIRKGKLKPAEELDQLRMLIHLVGDLHCPMHAGRSTDRGGNRVPVLYFGRENNLHSIWDTALVESAHKWSYSEWQQQIDRLSQADAETLCQGSPADWFRETAAITASIYKVTPAGAKISYDYLNTMTPVIEQQFLRGGLRLASLLNALYGNR